MSYKPYNSDNAVFYVNILVFSSLVKALVETFAWILSSSSVIMFCDRLLLNITWAVVTAVLRNPLQHLTVYSSHKSILVLAETILDVKLRKPARTIITDTASVQSTKKMTPSGVARELRIYTPGNTFFFSFSNNFNLWQQWWWWLEWATNSGPAPVINCSNNATAHISTLASSVRMVILFMKRRCYRGRSFKMWNYHHIPSIWNIHGAKYGAKYGAIATYQVYGAYMELNMELSPNTEYA